LAAANTVLAEKEHLSFAIKFTNSFSDGRVTLSDGTCVNAFEFFEFARELLKILLQHEVKVKKFRDLVWKTYSKPEDLDNAKQVEMMRVKARSLGLQLVYNILEDWPARYKDILSRSRVSPSLVTKELGYPLQWLP